METCSPALAAGCTWLIDALRGCVEQRLEQIPVNRTGNKLRQRQNRLEDHVRLNRVCELAGRVKYKAVQAGGGRRTGLIPLNRAYEVVAEERGRATGTHISAASVKSSCYRVLRRWEASASAGDEL
jgi:hypothetical protein